MKLQKSRRSPGQDHTGKQNLQNSKQQKEIKKIISLIEAHNYQCQCRHCARTRKILQATLKKCKTADELKNFYKSLN